MSVLVWESSQLGVLLDDCASITRVLFEFFQLVDMERLVPADVNEDFDTAIQLQEGLRGGRLGKSPLEGAKGEHGRP